MSWNARLPTAVKEREFPLFTTYELLWRFPNNWGFMISVSYPKNLVAARSNSMEWGRNSYRSVRWYNSGATLSSGTFSTRNVLDSRPSPGVTAEYGFLIPGDNPEEHAKNYFLNVYVTVSGWHDQDWVDSGF